MNKKLPKEDIKTLLHAVTNCPSKQNIAFYKVHFVQDRVMIEEIHEHTYGFSSYQGNRGTPPVYDPNEKNMIAYQNAMNRQEELYSKIFN